MTAQQLKSSILQMAVQGKLVPQEPTDEPASVLLERIREEKEEMIKAGKIKREKNPSRIFRGPDNLPYEQVGKNDPVCIADEVPFEIPDSWEWVRLGTLSSVISDGTHKTPNYVDSGVPFLSVQNISSGHLDMSKVKYIDSTEHQKLIERVSPQLNDILFCRIGTLGKAIKVTWEFPFSIFVSLGLIRPVIQQISDYIIFVFNSPVGGKWIQNNKVGGGTHTFKINLVDIPEMLIPLPPFKEQLRILKKVNECSYLMEQYSRLDESISVLEAFFPAQLKKSILQQAVQGKLVPQDPTDEPASVLLERIRAEKEQLIRSGKIKRDKHESVIYRRDKSHYEKVDGMERCIDDEIPFEIPDSWEWVRLDSVCEYIQRGKSPKYSLIKKYPVIAQKCNQWDGFSIEKAQFIEPDSLQSYGPERMLQDNDLMWNSTGLGTLGRVAIYKCELNPYELAVTDSHVTVIRPIKKFIDTNYLYFYLSSPAVQLTIEALADGSTKQKELATATIKQYLIPIPPHLEQRRIVEKIGGLLPMIDHLQ